MSIASELNNYKNGLEDAYDAVSDMSGTIPTDRNMVNLDDAIRTIPISSPNDGVLTITQNGVTIQTFSANQATNATAALTDTTYSNFTGATSSVAGAAGLVPAPTTADPDKYLKGDGSWDTPTGTTYTAGTNVSIDAQNVISATDTTYSNFIGATSSVAGSNGLVPAPAAGDEGKALHGDGTWKDTTAKLVEMYYGESNAWAKFIAAYNDRSIVYCRASSNANPGSGAKTRKAFMAYVNNEDNPTSVEFQYVRSVSSKTDSQQCDQVFVYTLTNASGGTWSVASRNMGPKINVSGPITKTFSTGANATVTIGADAMTGATSSADGAAGIVPKPVTGDDVKVLRGDGTWAKVDSSNIAPSVLEYQTGDSYTLASGDNTYFAGRTRTESGHKYIWFQVQLDKPVSPSVTATTFTASGYQEVFGPSGTIISRNNPSASELVVTGYVSSYNRKMIYCTMEIVDSSVPLTGNLCCSVHVGGSFSFS